MHLKTLITSSAVAALLATPAYALAAGPPMSPAADRPSAENHPAAAHKPVDTPTLESNPGTTHQPTDMPATTPDKADTPGPHAKATVKAKAYGTYCATASKKRVAGQKGTPFSQCVTAMAKLASSEGDNVTSACKALSKKRIAGQRGTPFSQCVTAAAKLLEDIAATDTPTDEPATEPTDDTTVTPTDGDETDAA